MRNYIIKLWLSTAIAGPLVLILFLGLDTNSWVRQFDFVLGFYFMAVPIGLALSLPAMLLLLGFVHVMKNRLKSVFIAKLWVIVLYLILMVITFGCFDGFRDLLDLNLVPLIAYGSCIVLFGLLFKMDDLEQTAKG